MRLLFEHHYAGRLDVAGACRPDGFTLSVIHVSGLLQVQCRIGSPEAFPVSLYRLQMLVPTILATILVVVYLGPSLSAPSWRLTIAMLGATLLYAGIKDFLRFLVNSFLADQTQWRWHACEHKAAIMLEGDVEPTEENMRQTNPVSLRCGTVQLVAGALVCMVLGFWLVHGGLGWFPVYLICIHARNFVRPRTFLDPEPSRYSRFIAAPVLLLALALERLAVIRTPTREQMEATTQLLRTLHENHPWTAPPRLR